MLNAGISSGLTINSKNINLNFDYSFIHFKGMTFSTDLFLYSRDLNSSQLKIGLGSGVLLNVSLDKFSSIFLIRFPIEYILNNNFFIRGIPIMGYTMFEYESSFVYTFSLSFGYRFDMYREE